MDEVRVDLAKGILSRVTSNTLALISLETMEKIDEVVLDELISFVPNRLAVKPGSTSRADSLDYADSEVPLVCPLTANQQRAVIQRTREEAGPSEFWRSMETNIQAHLDAGGQVAFSRGLFDALERQRTTGK